MPEGVGRAGQLRQRGRSARPTLTCDGPVDDAAVHGRPDQGLFDIAGAAVVGVIAVVLLVLGVILRAQSATTPARLTDRPLLRRGAICRRVPVSPRRARRCRSRLFLGSGACICATVGTHRAKGTALDMTGPLPADEATPPRTHPPRPRRRVLPIVVITVLVSLGLLAALIVPAIVRGLAATVSPDDRTIVLTNGTAQAALVLPGGWSWRTPFGDESRGVAGSPDRAMTIEFALHSGTDAPAALESIAPGAPAASEEILSDRTAGIGEILHARVWTRTRLSARSKRDRRPHLRLQTPSPGVRRRAG